MQVTQKSKMHFKLNRKHILLLLPLILISAVVYSAWVKEEVDELVIVRTDVAGPPQMEPEDQETSQPSSPDIDSLVENIEANRKTIERADELNEKLNISPDTEEKVYFMHATTPNDAIYPQWYTTIINAPNGWDVSTGNSDTLVAVIDTGYALAHEDLTDAWFLNAGEQGQTVDGDFCWSGSAEDKQSNDCDDDQNGYIDDWRGWDFSNDDNYPQAGDNSIDGATHGTKTSGLVGARGNNATGVAAVNWQTKIMPLQGLYDEGYGFSSHLAEAIVYAVDSGADVINLSLGSSSPDSIMYAAIRYADSNGVIVVASSGNCGDTQSSPDCLGYPSPGGMGYPARYPETIAVGATTSADEVAAFSSWGSEIDIVAPGSGSIRTPSWSSTNAVNLYSNSAYGTSFSAPIVSGLVASIVGEFDGLAKDEVLAILAGGADKVAAMSGEDWTSKYGWGRIDLLDTFSSIDSYRQQLEKAEGNFLFETNTQRPQISSNRGHKSKLPIKNTAATSAVTYCVTTPNTSCTLKLRQGGSTINLGSKESNQQGIVYWIWNRSDVSSTGTWSATTESNSLVSEVETLIVQ